MKFLSALAILPVLMVAPSPAQAQSAATQCTTIGEDLERLACYDALFMGSDGADTAVTLQSEQLIPARPSGRAPATVTVACEADQLLVSFAFAGNAMSALGNDAGITLQYDLQAARSRTLPVNDANNAILLSGRDAASFLDGLAGATNLTVRVTPVSSRSLSVRFRVDAFEQQVAPIRASCGA